MKTERPLMGSFHFLAKGDFKSMVLRILEERPMHGYEIIKFVEDRYHGFYKPSPGAIYPALRSLLRQGLVEVNGEERIKTYSISRKGKTYLRSRRAALERGYREFEAAVGPERAALFRELRTTGRVIGPNMRTVTPHQAVQLCRILVEMRERMMKILAK